MKYSTLHCLEVALLTCVVPVGDFRTRIEIQREGLDNGLHWWTEEEKEARNPLETFQNQTPQQLLSTCLDNEHAVADSIVADSTVADSTVADSTAVDSTAADSTAAGATVVEVTGAEATAAEATVVVDATAAADTLMTSSDLIVLNKTIQCLTSQ